MYSDQSNGAPETSSKSFVIVTLLGIPSSRPQYLHRAKGKPAASQPHSQSSSVPPGAAQFSGFVKFNKVPGGGKNPYLRISNCRKPLRRALANRGCETKKFLFRWDLVDFTDKQFPNGKMEASPIMKNLTISKFFFTSNSCN